MRAKGQAHVFLLAAPTAFAFILLGTSGAIAALGDTLFPAATFQEGWARDWSPAAHLFLRLRMLHPVWALLTGVAMVSTGILLPLFRPDGGVRRAGRILVALFVVQLALGILNVALLAPVWLQLTHLLLADAVWVSFVVLVSSALAQPPVSLSAASSSSASPESSATVTG